MLLIRHASAGDRDAWHGDDRERPLDDRGREQARALVDELASYRIDRIFSSPARRCLETVEPLARARGLDVEERAELGEERQWIEGHTLVRELAGDDVAVCGHGGLEQVLDDPPKWKKGAVLVLRRGARGPELE